jgi:uncharacterized protein (TIGR03083 family)
VPRRARRSWHHGRVEIAEHIDALDRDGALLADAADAAGLAAPVPFCPGWQVRDLVRHLAYVHDWSARHVRERSPRMLAEMPEADVLTGGPADAELIAAYRAGHAALVGTLRDADPGISCATFMPAPSPLAFWARRQAHETAVHRFDAQAARPGGPPGPAGAFGAAFADDGIDELVMGFAARRRYRLRGDGTRSLAIRAADTGGRPATRRRTACSKAPRPACTPSSGTAPTRPGPPSPSPAPPKSSLTGVPASA